MTSDRSRLRPWFNARLETNDTPGVEWVDKEKGTFSIRWRHCGQKDNRSEEDGAIFKVDIVLPQI